MDFSATIFCVGGIVYHEFIVTLPAWEECGLTGNGGESGVTQGTTPDPILAHLSGFRSLSMRKVFGKNNKITDNYMSVVSNGSVGERKEIEAGRVMSGKLDMRDCKG